MLWDNFKKGKDTDVALVAALQIQVSVCLPSAVWNRWPRGGSRHSARLRRFNRFGLCVKDIAFHTANLVLGFRSPPAYCQIACRRARLASARLRERIWVGYELRP